MMQMYLHLIYIEKYENQPDNLHSMCLADFASSFVGKKTGDVPIEPDEIKIYTVPVSDIDMLSLVQL